MSASSNIEWCDSTWNIVRGCRRVSPGCGGAKGVGGCYAERMGYRFSGKGMPYEGLVKLTKQGPRWTGRVRLVEELIDQPFRWRAPRRIFVDSMSDLFYERLADADIDRILAVMLLAPRHTFMVLTKRPDRMLGYLTAPGLYDRVLAAAEEFRRARPGLMSVPISNPTTFPARWIWWGTSVENQACADARLPALLQVPAAVRFVSAEPLLGPLDLWAFLRSQLRDKSLKALGAGPQPGVDWIIAGGESGPGARPCDPAWLASLRDQCVAAHVPYFLKQLGGHPKKRGHGEATLDGRRWTQFPEAR